MWDDWAAIEAAQQKADAETARRQAERAERARLRGLSVVPDTPEALRGPETAIEPMGRSLTPPDAKPALSATDPRNPVDPIHALRALLQRTRDELGGPDDG